jgi:hypothetical protein
MFHKVRNHHRRRPNHPQLSRRHLRRKLHLLCRQFHPIQAMVVTRAMAVIQTMAVIQAMDRALS